ncbi:hypothetical protein BLNAU_2550 [Blattamonas nauphoetae]|uniref:Uncharacterized protein n=1 Tax=Blattamonas nauphoetae TaxID=2049346 RepID=A0ABQ9YEW9_9EUKA|nr:hypothetical protein BLNAU_2550 [Blattamonas nauphoetae]
MVLDPILDLVNFLSRQITDVSQINFLFATVHTRLVEEVQYSSLSFQSTQPLSENVTSLFKTLTYLIRNPHVQRDVIISTPLIALSAPLFTPPHLDTLVVPFCSFFRAFVASTISDSFLDHLVQTGVVQSVFDLLGLCICDETKETQTSDLLRFATRIISNPQVLSIFLASNVAATLTEKLPRFSKLLTRDYFSLISTLLLLPLPTLSTIVEHVDLVSAVSLCTVSLKYSDFSTVFLRTFAKISSHCSACPGAFPHVENFLHAMADSGILEEIQARSSSQIS